MSNVKSLLENLLTGLARGSNRGVDQLRAIHDIEQALEQCKVAAIGLAREQDTYWSDIGTALGITGQAAGRWAEAHGVGGDRTTKSSAVKSIHPPDCGCADCGTGRSQPLSEYGDEAQFAALLDGRAVNRTGVDLADLPLLLDENGRRKHAEFVRAAQF
ncbi:hypothetical protein ACVDFE_00405 [Lentzea chajnantorensis]